MKIKINKLFGKYNNEIDFDRKCNIFIGENGIGKSTSIKILNCLFNYDFIGLINYYFESIEIIDNNESVAFNYEDLTLSRDYLLMKYCGSNYDRYVIVKGEFDEIKKTYPEVQPDDLSVTEKSKEDLDILREYYFFDMFCSEMNNRLLHKVLKFNNKLLINETLGKKAGDISDICLSSIKWIYKNASVICEEGRYYLNSAIKDKFNDIKRIFNKLEYDDVLIIDMARDFEVINDLYRKYAFNDLEKDSVDDIHKKVKEYNDNEKRLLHKKNDFRNINEIYSNYSDKNFIQKLKDSYKVNREVGLSGKKIDFGYFLFNKIYDEKFISEFKNDLYNFIYDNINDVKTEDKHIQYRDVSDETFNKIMIYLKPLIPDDNIFSEKLDIHWNDGNIFNYGADYKLLARFINFYKDKYFYIKDERLNRLNTLFQKYFKNKKVVATPFGISISTKDFNNDISFEELSAGEMKIIILFCIAVFSDNLIILFDEPESSLSVVWQEALIPDLINNSKFKRMVVATQSPYVIESEELDECIIPLIDGEFNE